MHANKNDTQVYYYLMPEKVVLAADLCRSNYILEHSEDLRLLRTFVLMQIWNVTPPIRLLVFNFFLLFPVLVEFGGFCSVCKLGLT